MTDRWLGHFMDRFYELGLDENTMIVLLSDHGYLLGERGYTGKVPSQLHPELAQVPLILVTPDNKAAGEVSHFFASTHDVGPTVLSMLGTWAFVGRIVDHVGAVHVVEAAQIYRADLGLDDTLVRPSQHMGNVWSLHGYAECCRRLGHSDEAAAMELQLERAQAVADVTINASCFCRQVHDVSVRPHRPVAS